MTVHSSQLLPIDWHIHFCWWWRSLIKFCVHFSTYIFHFSFATTLNSHKFICTNSFSLFCLAKHSQYHFVRFDNLWFWHLIADIIFTFRLCKSVAKVTFDVGKVIMPNFVNKIICIFDFSLVRFLWFLGPIKIMRKSDKTFLTLWISVLCWSLSGRLWFRFLFSFFRCRREIRIVKFETISTIVHRHVRLYWKVFVSFESFSFYLCRVTSRLFVVKCIRLFGIAHVTRWLFSRWYNHWHSSQRPIQWMVLHRR